MAGLGLTAALQSYQNGVQWNQQQQQVARQQEAQARIDAANKAASDAISASKAEWALNGAQGTYTPSDETLMRAAEARGQHFAKAGDWDNFVKNEASVQAQRTRVRGSALEQYGLDGDPERLMRSVYPTIFDGKRIKSVTKVGGAKWLSDGGDPPAPTMLQFELDDGTRGSVSPDDLVKRVKHSLIDPQQMAALEIKNNLEQAIVNSRNQGMLDAINARGTQAKELVPIKTAAAVEVEGVKTDGKLAVTDKTEAGTNARNAATNQSRETVGAGHDTARVAAGSSGGRGGSPGVQTTTTDASGRLIAVMRDGTTKVLAGADGAPLLSQANEKRVDSLVKELRKSRQNRDKSEEDLRAIARKALVVAPGGEQPATGLGATGAPASPGLSQAKQPPLASVQATIPEPAKRVVGQAYQTPRGPLVWRGNGWSVN
jgi:hypothetical protein